MPLDGLWQILPGFLTMDAMMWAANTTMLWHVYKERMTGGDLRDWMTVTSVVGGLAVLLTGAALVVGVLWPKNDALAIIAIVVSGVFAFLVVVAVLRLVRRIPD